MAELDSVITEMKTSSRERQDKMRDLREDVRVLTNKIPNLVDEQKSATEARLKEINAELLSLKTLITRVTSSPVAPPATLAAGPPSLSPAMTPAAAAESSDETPVPTPIVSAVTPTKPPFRPSTFASGSGKAAIPAWQLAAEDSSASSGKAAIPAWQLAAEGSS